MTDEKHSEPADSKDSPRTSVMGVREGKGADQYGGSFGGGQSGGGAYATPHGTDAEAAQDTGSGQGGGNRSGTNGSQSGYHGGGQAGAKGDTKGDGGDHHAANRGDGAGIDAATYRDHPSQQADTTDDQSERTLYRGVGNPDLAGEALEPGDRVQGADGRPVTGKG